MKKCLMIFVTLVMSVSLFAQTYPEVSIRDIQFVGDQIANNSADYQSPYEGDTVIKTGVVMHEVYIDGNTENDYVIHSGGPTVFVQDPIEKEWGGLLVRRTYDLSDEENALFALLDSGMVVTITGIVGDYPSGGPGQTQFNLIKFEGSDVIGINNRPKPIEITLDSLLQQGTNQPIYMGEKWENMYVEIKNVTVNHGLSTGGFSFGINDENGLNLIVDDKSSYFSSQPRPLEGTKIKSIRGMIGNRTNINPPYFLIDPIYPDDITYGDIFPARISNIERDIVEVKFGDQVTISANIKDDDGTVVSAKVMYYVNDIFTDAYDMSSTSGDTLWAATIPALNDSSLVSYYIKALDNEGNISNNPVDTTNGRYFYLVLNRPLTIKDVQYSPYGNGFSGYNNYSVTVSGRVSADTSDIPGDGSSGAQVYIQDGIGPWSGIQIFGVDAEGLKRGDQGQFTGIVNEQFGVTRIGNLDEGVHFTLLPIVDSVFVQPTLISTSDINGSFGGELPAESYEGVLVKYQNVSVVDENADGEPGPDDGNSGRNHGEILITDGSAIQTRVELQDGGHHYHNFWDASLENEPIRIIEGNTFDELVGIMYYSFSNFKLIPRNDEDFIGYTDVEAEIELNPDVFSLSQNYPNPFNPSTIIQYSIPMSEFVSLKIYDVLGREVQTLVKQEQSAGVYNVEFNAGNFTSGVYFYRIQAGSFVSVKKLLLLK